MELASDFSEFCASLNANHVEYLIVGAYAMALKYVSAGMLGLED